MKLPVVIALAQTAAVLAAPVPKASGRIDPVTGKPAEEVCGILGVMIVPEGEDESQYRLCAGHPSILDPNAEMRHESWSSEI